MTTLQEIFAAAQRLPTDQRAELINALRETITDDEHPPPSPGWMNEVQCRSEALDAGHMSVESWSKVRAEVRREVGLDD